MVTKEVSDSALIVFKNNSIRRKWFNNEWWFVIKDIVSVLTDSKNPSQYLKNIRIRDESLNEAFKGGVQFEPPLVWSSKLREVIK